MRDIKEIMEDYERALEVIEEIESFQDMMQYQEEMSIHDNLDLSVYDIENIFDEYEE